MFFGVLVPKTGALPTPKEQILFLSILSGQEQLRASDTDLATSAGQM